MPDMIFPSSEQNLGSPREINTINWETTFLEKLAEVRAQGDGTKLPADLLERLAAGSLDKCENCEDEKCPGCDGKGNKRKESGVGNINIDTTASVATAKHKVPPQFLEHQFKKKDDKGEEPTEEDEDETLVKRGKEAQASDRVHKVIFTSPEQLSAEALKIDLANGDYGKYNARLAARHDRRIRIAQRIIEQTKEQTEVAQKLAKRSNYRMTVISEASKLTKRLADSKQTVKTATSKVASFKSPAKMSNDKRQVAAQQLLSLGYDEDFVRYKLGLDEPAVSEAEQQIRDVMSSNLPEPTMRVALSTLVRTAMLSPEQVARQIKYWEVDLGYGAKDWIHDLFTTKYDDGGDKSDPQTTA